jgi:predicted GIY-YIG superfamily endonuclease
LLTPPHSYFVYLLHFHRRYYHAGHYTGMTTCLDARLALHRSGHGARLMKAVVGAGITFEVARLWQVATYEEARDLERTLKRRHDGPAFCPVCQQKPFDALTQMRRGHSPLLGRSPGKRRSMHAPAPRFVRRP